MGAVWVCEVVEVFPFRQFAFQINVALIAKKLVEFLPIGTERPPHFAIEVRGSRKFGVGMLNAFEQHHTPLMCTSNVTKPSSEKEK